MKSPKKGTVVAASSVLAAFGFAGGAVAQTSTAPPLQQGVQQLPEVTVMGHHNVQRQTVGRTSSGIPIEEVSISHHVGFQGIGDPMSPQGRAELDKRIQSAAEQACQQLKELYPLDPWGAREQQQCMSQAVNDAEQQVQTMIASGRMPRSNQ